jgi:hypothetical protein
MRSDMHELLVERPRWAHAARYPRAFVRNRTGGRRHEDAPAREALSRSRYGDKDLSENFAPLVRFLRRNVGRPWARVHSEMAKVLAPSNAVQRHVLVHLEDFLATRVYESEGVLWAARTRRGPEPLLPRTRGDQFFVHPRTTLLCAVPRAARPPQRAGRVTPAHVREVSPTCQLRRVRGVWYELTVAPFPPWPDRAQCVDALTRRRVRWESYDLHPEIRDLWDSGRYATVARQLSKREIRERTGA